MSFLFYLSFLLSLRMMVLVFFRVNHEDVDSDEDVNESFASANDLSLPEEDSSEVHSLPETTTT